jgi:hypothetical protein
MKTVQSIILALGLSALMLGASACSNDLVKKAEEFADKMCACSDKECAARVSAEMAEWLKADAEKISKARGSKADQEKTGSAGKRMMECARKLNSTEPS